MLALFSLIWNRIQRSTKTFQSSQRCRPSIIMSLLALFLSISALIFYCKNRSRPTAGFDLQTPVRFDPVMEQTNGTDIIWRIPESPKAALFIAHGCNGRAGNFWDPSLGCPHCVGLPEERLIVLHALARRFAVLTVSSLGRCWSFGEEKENVKWIIKWWIRRNKLDELPLVALGASSGGYFVSALAADEIKFSSITLMIAEGVFDRMSVPQGYPPTLFVHMPKDVTRMKLIGRYMKGLKKKGVDVKEVRCLEFPLTAKFLSDRILGLDESFAIKLLELFREKGFVDQNGYMRKDGRATHWKQALKKSGFSVEEDKRLDHIQEELNLAFGYHEMTSLQSDDIFDWFESHMS